MLNKIVKRVWIYLEYHLPDSLALRLIYYRKLGRVLHLNHPKAFTEKMQWLKVNYRPPILQQLADKFAARSYVESKIGAGALCKMYGVWDRAEDIPYDQLPDQFALKVTSGSHTNLFCRDRSKFNQTEATQKLRDWMSKNYYEESREWVYRDIKARVIAEELLNDGMGISPTDYKFYCFGGQPEFVEVDIGRGQKGMSINLMGMDWKPMPFTYYGYSPRPDPIAMPANFAEMARFARILSEGFPFARVDFYSIYGKTVFGEITWYPGSGLAPFQPIEWDLKIGEKVRLPTPLGETPQLGRSRFAPTAS
jgi:hypothetical protein